MPDPQQDSSATRTRQKLWRWIFGIALFAVAILVALGTLLISHAEPILRERVIETLSARFHTKVQLDGFHVSLMRGFQVSGEGLRLFGITDPNTHEPGIQPIISVAEFRFRTGLTGLIRSPMHVDTVYVKGLSLNLPPRGQRDEMKNMEPKGARIKISVDKFVCDGAVLVMNTSKPGKLPLEFDIESLRMTSIGPGEPLHFDAKLINPKPVGNIASTGHFGPWQADSPRDTPVRGTYSFSNADLSTIKGIGGILSSTGQYAGSLDNIVVDGSTDTPDFRIAISGRPVPLHTDFHAIVDGTNGDTYLEPVKAKILDTSLVANGSVVRMKEPNGHRVELDVTIAKGRIEDLLKLAVRTEPPVMTGVVRLKTNFDLPPGDPVISDRLKLSGRFQVTQAHFTNEKVQNKIDALSLRSLGKPKLAKENLSDNLNDNVSSDLSGIFNLENGVIYFSQLHFTIPGTHVNLTGKYSLDGNQFDFHGKALLDAKLSHMMTGWKSILLKPADPFFSKDGAGTELPVKVTGTKSEPHFGSDFGHKGRQTD
ncbi:MAG: AsmA-like C-terminal region-containing protein [Terriglobales bacterium]